MYVPKPTTYVMLIQCSTFKLDIHMNVVAVNLCVHSNEQTSETSI